MYKPKQLIFDIENAPQLGWFFGKTYETNILSVVEQSYILSVAYSWHPGTRVKVLALPDYKGYKKGNDCEKNLMKDVWELLNEADVVIGQNSDSFDIKHLNARFAFYGMTPPRPYKTVDTLKKLRQAFNLPSNKLDFVCNYFGIGGKLPNTGKDLWLGCMGGNMDDWKMMKKYNAHDVELTQKLYTMLMPWGKQPNLNILSDRMACTRCQSEHLIKHGHERDLSGKIYQRLKCMNCGAWNRDFGERPSGTQRVNIRPL
jgi:DNA polymerase elongation subunit (family B)